MKTISKKEFYEDLERERRKSLIVVNFGIVAVVVAVVVFVLLLLVNGEKEPTREEKEIAYKAGMMANGIDRKIINKAIDKE